MTTRYERRKAAGLCNTCRSKARPGMSHCQRCATNEAIGKAKAYAEDPVFREAARARSRAYQRAERAAKRASPRASGELERAPEPAGAVSEDSGG